MSSAFDLGMASPFKLLRRKNCIHIALRPVWGSTIINEQSLFIPSSVVPQGSFND